MKSENEQEYDEVLEVIKFEECNVNDFVVVESGDDIKWQGKIQKKVDDKLRVRWLKAYQTTREEEECGYTDLFEWDSAPMNDIEVANLIEIGAKLFHKQARPGFEATEQVFCRESTCAGRCVFVPKRKALAEETSSVVIKTVKKERKDVDNVPEGFVVWERNVIAECHSCDVEGSPFTYITSRESNGVTESRCLAENATCDCKRLLNTLKARLEKEQLSVDDVHQFSDACECPSKAIKTGDIPLAFAVQRVPNKGYGIFARESIARGSYLFEYVGEIISRIEASERELKYAENKRYYLHDVRGKQNHPSYERYVIDPTKKGNLARFLNHSCVPNVTTVEFMDPLDTQMDFNGKMSLVPRVTFFALKDIQAGEELCIDYIPERQAETLRKELKCYCGHADISSGGACRGWIF